MVNARLSASETAQRLRDLPGWSLSPNRKSIRARFRLKNFVLAVRLIDRIARAAEAADHHPDLHLTRYRLLTVSLTTHDAKGLTDRDFALAATIDRLFLAAR